MNAERFIARRAAQIGSSGIRRIFDLGTKLKNPIDLSMGQPDFDVPQNIKASLCKAINENRNGYTTTRGIPELRDRISQELQREFDWTPDVFVTSGVSGSLMLAMTACLDPGDEVLIPDPYFVSYPILTELAGGKAVRVSAYDDFHLDVDRFEKAITPRTKMILLTSPGNPTGVVYREQDVRAIAELARKHDLLIVSDEIYNLLTYDGPSPSPVSFAPERTLLLRGFGKSYALTGWRLGYAAGPTEIITEMAKLQQFTFVCAPQPGQWGAIEAMKTDISPQIDMYRKRRDLVCERLEGVVEFVRPAGGFYVFAKAPKKFENATAFVEKGVEKNLLTIPGSVFSAQDTHFRISYAVPDETLLRGCDIIAELAS
jgi:aspartate/methionine/tyrosine aminotransferase